MSDTKSNDGTTMELLGDCEIRISRTFNAPTRLVFEAITKQEYVKRWWAPRSLGIVLEVCEIDFRVGGKWRFVMNKNGKTLPSFYGEYLEIDAPSRIRQTEIFEPFPDGGSNMTVTLNEKDGKTTMVNSCVYPSKEVRDAVIASGMETGMRESMVQLTEVVASLL